MNTKRWEQETADEAIRDVIEATKQDLERQFPQFGPVPLEYLELEAQGDDVRRIAVRIIGRPDTEMRLVIRRGFRAD